MPQPFGVFSRPWQIPAMGEDHEGVCIDLRSGLETSLALPLLRAHHEHGTSGCAPLRSSLHLGDCGGFVVLSERGKGDLQCHPTGTGRCGLLKDLGPLSEAGKSPLSEDPTSNPGGFDRAKRTQAMGRVLPKWAFSASKSYPTTSGALPSDQVVAGSFDAPSRLTGSFGFSLSPHGPGKRKSGTETGSIPGVILPHPHPGAKGGFLPLIGSHSFPRLSHKSGHRHPPALSA